MYRSYIYKKKQICDALVRIMSQRLGFALVARKFSGISILDPQGIVGGFLMAFRQALIIFLCYLPIGFCLSYQLSELGRLDGEDLLPDLD